MKIESIQPVIDLATLNTAIDCAARAIPPAWPLASSVAVNPFLGFADDDLAQVAARLRRISGLGATMPRAWYLERISSGQISEDDLAQAVAASSALQKPFDAAALRSAAAQPEVKPQATQLPTIADLAAAASGIDWPGIIAERFGTWAAGYFDEGQALWAAPRGRGAYSAWRAVGTHDLTPELLGLAGFATHVAQAPERAEETLARATASLGLSPAAMATYFHQLLTTLGGWGQYARYRLWQAELRGASDQTLRDFLAIRLIWEEALLAHYGPSIAHRWAEIAAAHAVPVVATPDDAVDAALQAALEFAAQRGLAKILATPSTSATAIDARPTIQAVFCIDVRSEVFRRALEAVAPDCQTLGFAGFFGMPVAHRRFASDVSESRLPVLLTPGISTCSGSAGEADADKSARILARARRAWGRFKLAAVSSFAFVEATGPVYGAKLLRDALGLDHGHTGEEPTPQLDATLDLSARTTLAENALRGMSLTAGFAPLVLLVGHGANVVNNPHASGLDCGACGGHAGDVNARILAALLNDPSVREGLAGRGIQIPADSLFVAALHDTTTDGVQLFSGDHPSSAHQELIARTKSWLQAAGKSSRAERAARLPRAGSSGRGIVRRSRDWAEIRPEWGLAGCNAFIAAPRSRTRGKPLNGRVFLHEYDWRSDADFKVLELILTAPVVVASWISLQYYGSTVAPDLFGGGNKLLHNVVGGIGVVEGNSGVMRAGIAWQSLHDGESLVHEPLRLAVCIEAPTAAISDILRRHDGVRALFENHWLHLLALDDQGQIASRYGKDGVWSPAFTPATR